MALNRRNTFRNSINRIRDFTNDVVNFEAASIVALKERAKALNLAFEKLTTEHLNLVEEAADQAAVDVHNDYFAEVETTLTATAIKIQERIEHLIDQARQNNANAANQANNNANNNNNNNQQAPVAKEIPLERLKLSSFDGNHAKWKEWISMFDSLVHKRNYDNAEKFQYMYSALKGAAANTIGGWNRTGENYQAAYESLVFLYDNPYRITLALLDELFELKQMGEETYDNLRMLIDSVNRSTRQLKVNGCPVEQWDHVLVHFLLTRMPKETRSQWEKSGDLRAMPTMADVLAFIERQARGKLNLSQNSYSANQQQNNTGTKPKQMKQENKSNGYRNFGSKHSMEPLNVGIFCYHCEQPHPTYRCAGLNQMNMKQRRARVAELKLCFVCLSPGHRAGSNACNMGGCPNCKGRHNKILCDQTKSINSAMIQSVSNSQQYQQQLPANASSNPVAPPSGSVQYKGAINQMQANVWNQGISNQQTNQNFH